jgi:hypothetical protein
MLNSIIQHILITTYLKFGKEKLNTTLNNFYYELDKRLEKKFGKDGADKIEMELIEILEGKINSIKQNLG